MNLLETYILVVNGLSAVGIVYLLWRDETSLALRSKYHLVVGGIVVFIVISPVVERLFHPAVHWLHGLSAAFIFFGLQLIVHQQLEDEDWPNWLLSDPSTLRASQPWMAPMDDQILELFHSSSLVLTPSIIALNLDRSREEVNRRLIELEDHELVERVDRGKYRITNTGKQYLEGRTGAASTTSSTSTT